MEHELQILKSLPKHTNIIEFISDDEMVGFKVPSMPHYYIKYCEKGDLSKFIESVETPMSASYSDLFITDVYKQVLSGLKHLYVNYVIHSDIKEDNILVTIVNDKPVYKIADFGLSINIKTLPRDTSGNINQYDIFINSTPLYRPSYLKFTTHFRDLYALYCLLYWLTEKTDYNTETDKSKTISTQSPFRKELAEINKYHTYLHVLQNELMKLYIDPTSNRKIIRYDTISDSGGDQVIPVLGDRLVGEKPLLDIEKDHAIYSNIYKI